MTPEIRMLDPGEHTILNNVAPGVFDNPTNPTLVAQFLRDHRHHLQHAKRLGCREAWVLTDRSNHAAMRLYASAGGEEAPHDQVMFTFLLDREDRSVLVRSCRCGARLI